MVLNDVGYNVSPINWFKEFPQIGKEATYLTDYRGISTVLGPVRANQEFNVGLFNYGNKVSFFKTRTLERNLGLDPGSLSSGFKFSRVTGISKSFPRSPLYGNEFFTRGAGLPGGAPEIAIDPLTVVKWPWG